MAELKKDFTRGQENAQDSLNANFTELQKIMDFINENKNMLGKAQKRIDEKSNADWETRNVVYYRQGDMVTARVVCKPSASSNGGWKTISQFPVGYQPASRADIFGVLRQNSISAVGTGGTIYANGNGFSSILEDGTKKYSYSAVVTYTTSDEFPESDRVSQFGGI